MKKFIQEFKAFALKGNVMDLAVGVIIGAAFQGVVASLTENILSPIIGLFAGQNFDGLQLSFLGVTLQYGAFLTSVMNFIIMAFVVFSLVKVLAKLSNVAKLDTPVALPVTKKCPFCCTQVNVEATRCPACTSQLEP